MRNTKNKICKWLLFVAGLFFILVNSRQDLLAQSGGRLLYLRAGTLHSFFSERATEPEFPRHSGGSGLQENDGIWWPAEYGERLSSIWARGFWIGTKDFMDPVLNVQYSHKVVGVGPRSTPVQANMVFEQEHLLIGKYDHPEVYVDGSPGTENDYEDILDRVNSDLISDRMIYTKVHTSIGITMTRKIYSFSHQNYDNIFFYEYVLKNTGIINDQGTTINRTLTDVMFMLINRYAPGGGEPYPRYGEGWGIQESNWGSSAVNQVRNHNDSTRATIQYVWYGPHSERNVSDDYGCPNEQGDGILGGVQYVGVVTLHVDKTPQNQNNWGWQPITTYYQSNDDEVLNLNYNQYDEENMKGKYEFMEIGHPDPTQADDIIAKGVFCDLWGDNPGGYAQTTGYGPWTLAPGDSVRVVLAEGVAGINRELNREVGRNWLLWSTGEDNPTLIRPNGEETDDHDLYKREWVLTGEDSIIQTFDHAVQAFSNNYVIPQPPPPPSTFEVLSTGTGVRLIWAHNAVGYPNFDGYVVYRSQGSVRQPYTVYNQIFECDASLAGLQVGVGTCTYDDTATTRGTSYYYWVQSKDNGSTNIIKPGVPLKSDKFWTLTAFPATRLSPPNIDTQEALEKIRIVPNPYDIRSTIFQFARESQGNQDFDKIGFFNLPPQCTIRIFTERGDLIWQKERNFPSGDEYWNSQTSDGQLVVSGLYIVHFATPNGNSIIRKLIIIR